MSGNSLRQYPMIYVTPDTQFVDFVRKNEYMCKIIITDTQSNYDNIVLTGNINISSNIPNCRPNFFDKTGYYTITIEKDWLGYPPKLGNVNLIGMKKKTDQKSNDEPKEKTNLEINNYSENISKNKGNNITMNRNQIILICSAIIVLFLIVIVLKKI